MNKYKKVCPLWTSFLCKIFDSNKLVIEFVQRAVGYSLTGHTTEQCLFFLHGNGANGKSTFLNILRALLGDSCQIIDPETLMVSNKSGGATPEIARLRGARVLICNELEEGKRLAESRVKQMTGGDAMVARQLYREEFEFVPSFKIWMAGNHRPAIVNTDFGIWRRIHLIPFTVTISKNEQDPKLTEKLMSELPGILQWAVGGCKELRKQRLNPPPEVKAAVDEYRADMDTTGQWLEDQCVFDSNAITPSGVLYADYQLWVNNGGQRPHSQRRLGDSLRERGLVNIKTRGVRCWQGVRLARDASKNSTLNDKIGLP